MKKKIYELEQHFTVLKEAVLQCLKKLKISVSQILEALTEPDSDDHDRVFLEKNISILFKASDHHKLFEHMNSHWNYLDPSLLYHLVSELQLGEVTAQMEAYESDLQCFRRSTSLAQFCHVHQSGRSFPIPRTLRKNFAKFKWPRNRSLLSLEVVEQFRQEFATNYSLHDCAVMVQKLIQGSTLY